MVEWTSNIASSRGEKFGDELAQALSKMTRSNTATELGGRERERGEGEGRYKLQHLARNP